MTEPTDGQEAAPEATAAPAEEAPAQVEDTTSEATAEADGDDAPDGDEEHTADTSEPKKPAKGVQKRLDELTRRIHEERREKERLYALLERGIGNPATAPIAQPEGPPREDQFESYEDYEQARIDYAVEQRLRQAREEEQRSTVFRTYEERAAKLRETAPDFDSVVNDPTLNITPLMAEVIRESDLGPEVAYHLGTNRSEAERIASLPPHRQAAELGRLEARLTPVSQAAPTPKRTPPPAPPQTVAGISNGLNKAPEDMSMAEYVKARESGQI